MLGWAPGGWRCVCCSGSLWGCGLASFAIWNYGPFLFCVYLWRVVLQIMLRQISGVWPADVYAYLAGCPAPFLFRCVDGMC